MGQVESDRAQRSSDSALSGIVRSIPLVAPKVRAGDVRAVRGSSAGNGRMEEGDQLMDKKDKTPKETGKQLPRPPERGGEETERAERSEPGTGGLSKAAYDKATEQAVKDIHG